MRFIVMTEAGRECGILDLYTEDSQPEILMCAPIDLSYEQEILSDKNHTEQITALPELRFDVTTYYGADGTRTRRLEVKNSDLLLLYSLPKFTPLLLSEPCSKCGHHGLEEEKALIRSGQLKVEGLIWSQE